MGFWASVAWRWCVVAWAASTGIAHAAYQCQDGWGRSFRVPLVPEQLSDALKCTPVPPPAPTVPPLTGPTAASLAGMVWPSAPTAASARTVAAAVEPPRRGRFVMKVEAPAPRAPGSGAIGPHPFDPLISAAARRYGHDERLIKAIVYVESRFDPSAVSPKGAVGLMQLMPATASELGVVLPAQRLLDPALNLDTGARHLRRLMDTFADRPDLAIAAYNAGESAVMRYGRRVPPFPETQNYVRDVLAHFDRLRLHGRAGDAPGG